MLYAFTNKDKRICLKSLNKQIAARAKEVWHRLFAPDLRRSQIFCPSKQSTILFQFQTETAILQEWYKTRALHTLIGIETNRKNGRGADFNFILNNGTRSNQRDEGVTYYDHKMPKKALKNLRSVTIHYHDFIMGFSFFDKDGELLWKIGYFPKWLKQ